MLSRLAAGAEVPVFLARGAGGGRADAVFRDSPQVRLLDSPRAATVLVVAGRIPAVLADPLDRIHDQMARPRATVWWTGGDHEEVAASWPEAAVVGPDGDPVSAAVRAHRDLLEGRRMSEPPRLPDVEPAEWRGVGPYGQGGKAMTGGVPYGRPMAGRGDDRDGLSLDVLPVGVGPFLPILAPCLGLQVTFAGDVVVALEVRSWRVDAGGVGGALPDEGVDPFLLSHSGRAVPLADLEVARARHHLRSVSRLLHVHGLDALARRAAGIARRAAPGASREVVELARRLDRPWVLGRQTAGVGTVAGADALAWGGIVARAAGFAVDARRGSAPYEEHGFEVVTFTGGDIRDRWRQRLAEAAQSLDLAGVAGEALVDPATAVEWPSPPADDGMAEGLPRLLEGLEWGEAASTIASLDPALDLPVPAAPR